MIMKEFMGHKNIIKQEGGKLPPLDVIEENLGDDEIVGGEEVALREGVQTKESRIKKDEDDIENSYK